MGQTGALSRPRFRSRSGSVRVGLRRPNMSANRGRRSELSIVAMAGERSSSPILTPRVAGPAPASVSPGASSGPSSAALGGYGTLWIARPLMLERIATWGAGRRARSQATDVDRRLAVGAATALAEMVQATAFGSPLPWERAFDGGVEDLAERMGSSLGEATTGLDWIIRTGTAVRSGGDQFLIPEELWAPAPGLASIAWSHVREQLRNQAHLPARLRGTGDRGGRLAPALAVLRALAERPEALRAAAGASAHASAVTSHETSGEGIGGDAWGKTSVAHLINATLFGRSAVLDALGRLEAAAMIARRRFPGSHEGDDVQLLPAAFGRSNPAAEVTSAAITATDRPTQPHAPAASTLASFSASASATPAATPHGTTRVQLSAQDSAQQLVPITVAGVTMRVPPGTTVTIHTDAAGRRVIHVGDDIVIGPLS